ncbi:MAG: hypothetical protein MJ218_00430 [Opitutales bacterium]|nr:hypothetical protein [Opitutales bacterium]
MFFKNEQELLEALNKVYEPKQYYVRRTEPNESERRYAGTSFDYKTGRIEAITLRNYEDEKDIMQKLCISGHREQEYGSYVDGEENKLKTNDEFKALSRISKDFAVALDEKEKVSFTNTVLHLITFDSIVSFFNQIVINEAYYKTLADKAKAYNENADLFMQVLGEWLKKVSFVQKLHMGNVLDDVYYRLPNEPTGDVEALTHAIDELVQNERGKQRMILLLCLDGLVPADLSLCFCDTKCAQFISEENIIDIEVKSEWRRGVDDKGKECYKKFPYISPCTLWHELGHACDYYLGVIKRYMRDDMVKYQKTLTSIAYEIPFTRSLFSLNAKDKDNTYTCIKDMGLFKDTKTVTCSKEDFLWEQLQAQWGSFYEVDNIIGILPQKQGDQYHLFVNDLSDIQVLKKPRWGHPRPEIYQGLFENTSFPLPNDQDLELLFKLHDKVFVDISELDIVYPRQDYEGQLAS